MQQLESVHKLWKTLIGHLSVSDAGQSTRLLSGSCLFTPR